MSAEPLHAAAWEEPPAAALLPPEAVTLSTVALAAAAVASAVTLAWDGAFPDPVPAETFNGVLAEGRGWSAATLLLGVPLGAIALSAALRGSLRGRLALAGAMAYLVYTYLELAVSPPFTALYLIYVLAFACALPALIYAVASIDLAALPAAFGDRVPRRSIAAFGFAFAAVLALAWSKGIVAAMIAGEYGYPTGSAAVGHVVHALDLGLQVPLGLATGLLLLARRPAGYVVAALSLVMGVFMGTALFAMVAASAAVSDQSLWVAVPFLAIPLVSTALGLGFFGAVNEGGS